MYCFEVVDVIYWGLEASPDSLDIHHGGPGINIAILEELVLNCKILLKKYCLSSLVRTSWTALFNNSAIPSSLVTVRPSRDLWKVCYLFSYWCMQRMFSCFYHHVSFFSNFLFAVRIRFFTFFSAALYSSVACPPIFFSSCEFLSICPEAARLVTCCFSFSFLVPIVLSDKPLLSGELSMPLLLLAFWLRTMNKFPSTVVSN